MEHPPMLVDGEWLEASDGQVHEVFDPGLDEVIAVVPEATYQDVDRAVTAAQRVFEDGAWRSIDTMLRQRMLLRVADLLDSNLLDIALVEARNTGKPLKLAEANVRRASYFFRYYAGHVGDQSLQMLEAGEQKVTYVVREPVGVVAIVFPWNFPIQMAAMRLSAALAAGNSCVLKPPEEAPLSTLLLVRLCLEAGIPSGAVNCVTGIGERAGQYLVSHPSVDKVAFCGGTETGKKILRACADTVKRSVLELGGKTPQVLFGDADLKSAIEAVVFGTVFNQGEVCNAGSRLLVEESVVEDVVRGIVAKLQEVRIGYCTDPDVQMGPLITRGHWKRVSGYVEIGKQEGARLLCGGGKPDGDRFRRGYYYAPTVFDDVTPTMRIAQEEIFGPVLSVIRFHGEEEAVEIANGTMYGLAAAVWTRDVRKALRVVGKIRAGVTWVNTFDQSPQHGPWGGFKQSGIGREKGRYSLEEYTEIKQVTISFEDQPVKLN